MVLTGKGDEYPLIASLGVGADDYLTKPIRLDELIAPRVRARLRSRWATAEQARTASEELYRALVEHASATASWSRMRPDGTWRRTLPPAGCWATPAMNC